MIICHDYKFIFIKTNKTAGTSIEIALSIFCGANDIIPPLLPEDEAIRSSLGYREPQNYQASYFDNSLMDSLKYLLTGKRKKKFYSHISAKEIIQYIGPQIWDDYFTFCFERNPWDRIISLYYWHYQSKSRPTITEFLATDIPLILKRNGYDLYTINDEIVVDRVCRFENISEELEIVRRRLGIPQKLELPKAKSRFREDKRNYRDILTDTEKVQVENIFSNEIKLFNYSF